MDFGAFAGGLSQGLKEDPLKKKMMGLPGAMPDAGFGTPQIETEIGDVPMGYQLQEPIPGQPGKFGGLKDLMTRLFS